jgi:hypothetical protein
VFEYQYLAKPFKRMNARNSAGKAKYRLKVLTMFLFVLHFIFGKMNNEAETAADYRDFQRTSLDAMFWNRIEMRNLQKN